MLMSRAIPGLAVATFLLAGIGVGGLSADAPEAPGVDAPNGYEMTVFNAHRYAVDVYLEGPQGEEDHLLGTVESDAVRTFSAPEARTVEDGTFRISIRPAGPQPGLGESRTTARKILQTQKLPRPFDGEIKLIVTPNIQNSSVSLVEYVS